MKSYVEGIKEAIDQMEKPLERLVTEAKNVSEKVISRENFLNTQFSRQLDELHESQVQQRKKLFYSAFPFFHIIILSYNSINLVRFTEKIDTTQRSSP